MRLSLLYDITEQPWGGVNTFFRNFAKQAAKDSAVKLVPYKDADIVLSSGHYRGPGRLLNKSQLRNIRAGRLLHHPFGFFSGGANRKIAFRLDGLRLFYSQAKVPADKVLLENMPLADSIIFQSEFSKTCFDSLKIPYSPVQSIIHNGADSDLFFPADILPSMSPLILISNSWSSNVNKGFETLARFSELKDIEILHIGRWPEDFSPKRVKVLGPKRESEIAQILRKGHFFLFPARREACPNTVVEALASGLPVIYLNSGGTPELCEQTAFGLPFEEDCSLQEFSALINGAKDRYSSLRQNILSNLHLFAFKRCYQEYMSHFNRVLS